MDDNALNDVIIMLGSNTGDRKGNLDKGVESLRSHITSMSVTRDIDTPDFTGRGPDYLNRIVTGKSSISFPELKRILRDIETEAGRDRSIPSLVALDIDIVVYNGTIVKSSEYTSPPCRALLNPGKQP